MGDITPLITCFTGLGAVLVAWAVKRQTGKRDAATEQRARIEDERKKEQDEALSILQASAIEVRVDTNAGSVNNGQRVPLLDIRNPTNQPITDLILYDAEDRELESLAGLGPGSGRKVPLQPISEDFPAIILSALSTLHFTDAAGLRWMKDGGGGLRRGRSQSTDGQWRWGPRQAPAVSDATSIEAIHYRGRPFLVDETEIPASSMSAGSVLTLGAAAITGVASLIALIWNLLQ